MSAAPPFFLKRRGLFPNWTSPGRASYHVKKTGTTCTTNTELLLENHDTKPRFGNYADVSSSEEETADTVPGDVQTQNTAKYMKVILKSLVKSEITAFAGVFVVTNQFIGSGILNCAGLFGVSLLLGGGGAWRESGPCWGNVLP